MRVMKISSHEQQGQVTTRGKTTTVLFDEQEVTKTNEDGTTYTQWEYIGVILDGASRFVDVVGYARGFAKSYYQNKEIAKGCVTSVMDSEGNPIVMQCGKDDILLLTNSPLKTMVRDISNVQHTISEAEFDTIIADIRVRGAQIWQESQAI